MPTAALYTLGCRLNQAETAIISNKLEQQGYEIVDYGKNADLTVIHTCTVTEQADAKCRHAVRQSVRRNPDTYVAVIGCYAQMAVDTIRQIDGVDLIMGNEHKMNLPEYLDGLAKRGEPRVIHTKKLPRNTFTIETLGITDTHTRANLKIQDGCNFICSFCIIATARGPARSRSLSDIVREARLLVEQGFKEVILSGVNIGTYLDGQNRFIDMVKALEGVDGLERIRISSIEPTTVTYELIDHMAASPKVCNFLHVPLQSGDDRILESMRRKHDASFFSKIMSYAYDTIPDVGLGTDIMVGYPGEDEQAFNNTKRLLADLPIPYYHVFTYSDRKGTRSYKMTPKVAPEVKKNRRNVLIEQGDRQKFTYYRSFIGRTMEVLFEQPYNGLWQGLTDNYMRVAAAAEEPLKNEFRTVQMKDVENDRIVGEIL